MPSELVARQRMVAQVLTEGIHHRLSNHTWLSSSSSLSCRSASLCGPYTKGYSNCSLSLWQPVRGFIQKRLFRKDEKNLRLRVRSSCVIVWKCKTPRAFLSGQAFWQKFGNDRAFFLVGCVKRSRAARFWNVASAAKIWKPDISSVQETALSGILCEFWCFYSR